MIPLETFAKLMALCGVIFIALYYIIGLLFSIWPYLIAIAGLATFIAKVQRQ